MILLKSEQPWQCGPFRFEAGEWYVEGATAGTALTFNGGVEVRSLPHHVFWTGRLRGMERVLVVRSGGFGDLLFMTPLLRALKQQYPGIHLELACTPYYADAVRELRYLDGVREYPVAKEVLNGFDQVLWLEGLIEWDERARNTHYVDLLAQGAGVVLSAGKHLDMCVSEGAVLSMIDRFPRLRGKGQGSRDKGNSAGYARVGVQLRASARCRTYPRLGEVLKLLVKEMPGVEVLLFGEAVAPWARSQASGNLPANVRDLRLEDPALSFMESCALVASCDVMVAPDSALCHVAGALGVPTVALYGSFPWELRTKYAGSVRALTPLRDDVGGCEGPCFWHGRAGEFPPGCPGVNRMEPLKSVCARLAAIEPERVVNEIRKQLTVNH